MKYALYGDRHQTERVMVVVEAADEESAYIAANKTVEKEPDAITTLHVTSSHLMWDTADQLP